MARFVVREKRRNGIETAPIKKERIKLRAYFLVGSLIKETNVCTKSLEILKIIWKPVNFFIININTIDESKQKLQ